jgi:hypothetical protein
LAKTHENCDQPAHASPGRLGERAFLISETVWLLALVVVAVFAAHGQSKSTWVNPVRNNRLMCERSEGSGRQGGCIGRGKSRISDSGNLSSNPATTQARFQALLAFNNAAESDIKIFLKSANTVNRANFLLICLFMATATPGPN